MGAIGGVLRATDGPPQYSTIKNTKNAALQSSIDSSISGLSGMQTGIDAGLSDFETKYRAGEGAAASRTGQEIGAMDQFYNGSMANQLAQLRATRQGAVTNAADLASKQAIAAQNRSRLTGSGGMSSYNTRMTMGNLTPVRVQAALDDANQQRADLGYLTQNQIGLAGQRTGLATKQAGYGLVPSQTRLQMGNQMNQYRTGLANLDQANNFYGLQKKGNMWADVADSLDAGILNAAAIYGTVAGGGAGGAPSGGGGGGGMGGSGDPGGELKLAGGGMVRGPGTGTSDSIPARLSKGEFVVPADVVNIPGVLPLLEKMRHLHRMHHVGRHQERLKDHLKRQKERKAAAGKSNGGMVRGYSGGGLAGSAQQLNARASEDQHSMFEPASMIPDTWSGSSAGGSPGQSQRPQRTATNMPVVTDTPSMAPNRDQGMQGTPYFHPDNWQAVPDEWKVWGAQTADKYNNPKSPDYIAPGTYE